MTFRAPDWWQALLLALACYRLFRLLAEDVILDRPRHMLVRLPKGWQEGDQLPSNYRYGVARFVTCPACLGFHISWVVWLVWERWPHETLIACAPLALSAFVLLVGGYPEGE